MKPAEKIAKAKATYDRETKIIGGASTQAFHDLVCAYLDSIEARLESIEKRIAAVTRAK